MNGTSDYVEGYVYDHFGTTITGSTGTTNFTGALIAPVSATSVGGNWTTDGTYTHTVANQNVGISSTTPWGLLSITPNGITGPSFVIGSSTQTNFIVTNSGNVGIGTTSPQTLLGLQGGIGVNSSQLYLAANGNVGIGSTSPQTFLGVGSGALSGADYISTIGIVNSNGYRGHAGVGAAIGGNVFNIYWTGTVAQLWIDATNIGNITVSSDSRVKKNIAPIATSSGLDAINALNPVTFNWLNPEAGTTTQYGFIAQQVRDVLPDLVSNTGMTSSTTPDGLLHLDYNGLFAPIVKAIQEITNITGTFKVNLIVFLQSWLADATNGIVDLVALAIHSQEDITQRLCLTDGAGDQEPLCLTKRQLAALIDQSGVPNVVVPDLPVTSKSTSPPVDLPGQTASPVVNLDTGADTTHSDSEVSLRGQVSVLPIVSILAAASTTSASSTVP